MQGWRDSDVEELLAVSRTAASGCGVVNGGVNGGVGLRHRAVRVGRRRRALANSVSSVVTGLGAPAPYITHASLPVLITNRQ
jgi:hypothetical protein